MNKKEVSVESGYFFYSIQKILFAHTLVIAIKKALLVYRRRVIRCKAKKEKEYTAHESVFRKTA